MDLDSPAGGLQQAISASLLREPNLTTGSLLENKPKDLNESFLFFPPFVALYLLPDNVT